MVTVQKSDVVRARNGAFIGNGFVHYILSGGDAMVEHPNGKVYIHVSNLEKVEE